MKYDAMARNSAGVATGAAALMSATSAIATLSSCAVGRAQLTPEPGGSAFINEERNIRKWLRVQPEEPQQVAWVSADNIFDYQIQSNTNWFIS